MNSNLKLLIALITALGFLIESCATTTKEISRSTIRVDREQIQGDLELTGLDLRLSQHNNLLDISMLKRGNTKIKETDIEEIHFREIRKESSPQLSPEDAAGLGLFNLIAIPLVIILAAIPPSEGGPNTSSRDFHETKKGKERIVKEEVTIPAKDAPLDVKVNGFQQILKSDHEGKAELDLLPIINNLDIIPNQLKVTCLAKIKDKSVSGELVIQENEVFKIVQSETGRPKLAANPVASIKFEKSEGILQPGNADKLIVTVSNQGKGEAYQLKGVIICPDPILDRKEFLFGRLDPGKTKKASIAFEIPKDYPSKTLPIEIHFSEYNKYTPEPVEIYLRIVP